MRCFIALGLDGAFRADLADWLEGARRFRELAVTPVENLHLTLEFLGEIDDVSVAIARSVVEETAEALRDGSKHLVAWSAPGAFPTRRRPRVLWLGVDDADGWLSAAHDGLADRLRDRGLPVDERRYRPHLTLGRVRKQLPRERADELLAYLDSAPVPAPSPVTGVALFRSRLDRPHAVHDPITDVGII